MSDLLAMFKINMFIIILSKQNFYLRSKNHLKPGKVISMSAQSTITNVIKPAGVADWLPRDPGCSICAGVPGLLLFESLPSLLGSLFGSPIDSTYIHQWKNIESLTSTNLEFLLYSD